MKYLCCDACDEPHGAQYGDLAELYDNRDDSDEALRRCGCCEELTDQDDPYCVACDCDDNGRARPSTAEEEVADVL